MQCNEDYTHNKYVIDMNIITNDTSNNKFRMSLDIDRKISIVLLFFDGWDGGFGGESRKKIPF